MKSHSLASSKPTSPSWSPPCQPTPPSSATSFPKPDSCPRSNPDSSPRGAKSTRSQNPPLQQKTHPATVAVSLLAAVDRAKAARDCIGSSRAPLAEETVHLNSPRPNESPAMFSRRGIFMSSTPRLPPKEGKRWLIKKKRRLRHMMWCELMKDLHFPAAEHRTNCQTFLNMIRQSLRQHVWKKALPLTEQARKGGLSTALFCL